MKRNSIRQSSTRLRSLDAAQLQQISGGLKAMDMYTLGNLYDSGTGWREFYYAAGGSALTWYGASCTCN